MGWETGVSLGFNALSGINKMQQGSAQAQAQVQTGENVAQNEADATVRKIGGLQSSFLHSGIALDNIGGTAAVFQQAATQGYTNISRTISNTNAEASNTYNAARTASLESIASGFKQFGPPNTAGVGDAFKSTTAYALNDMGFGNTAYDMLDPSP
jgi:hypothetical protein